MEDRVIQLDASFDHRASYTMLVWLRPRDATVAVGEPVAVVIDGSIQRVIPAPCSGRIVSVFVDAGAPLLPRAVIGLIRPSLPIPEVLRRSPLGAIAAALIVVTIGIVSLGNALPADGSISLANTEPVPTFTVTSSDPTALPTVVEPTSDPAAPTPAPVDPAAEPTATLDAALPLQPTADPDPLGTGVDGEQVRRDAINWARQLMSEALANQQYLPPGPIDDVNWSNYIEPTYTHLLELEKQINSATDAITQTSSDQTLREYMLLLAEQHIQACIDPYRNADAAYKAASELPDPNSSFIQCQQYLNELPSTD